MKSQKRKIAKQDTQHLTTENYNQNEELYRTYLQSLYLRLRDQPNDKSEVNTLIKNYLKAEEKLLQVAKTDKYPTITSKETYQREIQEANQEIDANERHIFELDKDINTKAQQKKLLFNVLKINIQNYKKVLETYSHTISQPENTYDRVSQKHITFEILNLEDKFDQVTINRVIDNAKNAYQEAESHKLQGGLQKLQLQKEILVRHVCEVIEKEPLPQELYPLYERKDQTLKSITATQSQISNYNSQIEDKQRDYDETSHDNKLLQQEINRLRQRKIDQLLLFEVFEQETTIQPTLEGEMPQQLERKSEKKGNKMIAFQYQTPKKTRTMQLCWAVAIVLFWLIAV